MSVELLIFDFDGVIADSEGLACAVLADLVTELGAPLTQQEVLEQFTGRRIGDVTAAVEGLIGRKIPDFPDRLLRRTLAAFETGLREIAGVRGFLESHSDLRRCIASSSSLERIRFCLTILKLESCFGDALFSADVVERGKPYPDIFLYAAERMGVPPSEVIVIEDSPGGVRAAVGAGMRVIGLLAATHLAPGHGATLSAAGATWIANDYDDISRIIARQ